MSDYSFPAKPIVLKEKMKKPLLYLQGEDKESPLEADLSEREDQMSHLCFGQTTTRHSIFISFLLLIYSDCHDP